MPASVHSAMLQPSVSTLFGMDNDVPFDSGFISRYRFQNTYTDQFCRFQKNSAQLGINDLKLFDNLRFSYIRSIKHEINDYQAGRLLVGLYEDQIRNSMRINASINNLLLIVNYSVDEEATPREYSLGLYRKDIFGFDVSYQLRNSLDQIKIRYSYAPYSVREVFLDKAITSRQFSISRNLFSVDMAYDLVSEISNRDQPGSPVIIENQTQAVVLKAGPANLSLVNDQFKQRIRLFENTSAVLDLNLLGFGSKYQIGYKLCPWFEFQASYSDVKMNGYALLNEYAYTGNTLSLWDGVNSYLINRGHYGLRTYGLKMNHDMYNFSLFYYQLAMSAAVDQNTTYYVLNLPDKSNSQNINKRSDGLCLGIDARFELIQSQFIVVNVTQIIPLISKDKDKNNNVIEPASGGQARSVAGGKLNTWGGLEMSVAFLCDF